MDALWFWFAKFLVDVGLVVGFILAAIVVGIAAGFVVEWRMKTGRDSAGRYARRQLLQVSTHRTPLTETSLLGLVTNPNWTVHTRRGQEAVLNRLVKQGYYVREDGMLRRTTKQER